jgi:hypothetical protein
MTIINPICKGINDLFEKKIDVCEWCSKFLGHCDPTPTSVPIGGWGRLGGFGMILN